MSRVAFILQSRYGVFPVHEGNIECVPERTGVVLSGGSVTLSVLGRIT